MEKRYTITRKNYNEHIKDYNVRSSVIAVIFIFCVGIYVYGFKIDDKVDIAFGLISMITMSILFISTIVSMERFKKRNTIVEKEDRK